MALFAGCATPPPSAPPPAALLHDDAFGAAAVTVSADEIFALSDEMRRYLRTEVASQIKLNGSPWGLISALYTKGQLRLEYDSTVTRNAAEAFAAKSGNCLSLVVMTAAFAKELGLQVRFQSAYLEEAWSRTPDLLLRAGHVNIVLGPKLADRANPLVVSTMVDFLPPDQLRRLPTREIPERTIVAMFMNNRAVEALIHGQLDDAYAWTRGAMTQDPDFLAAYNTLGILYGRRGREAAAAAAFRHVLERDPAHTRAMANLSDVYARQGRADEAAALRQQLARLEPVAPFQNFNQGVAAMQRKDYAAARSFFEREIERGGYSSEVTYWLGLAHYQLGDYERAARLLRQSTENSATRSDREAYSTKLSRLKSGAGGLP